jgi:hypothetical protein
MVHYVLAIQGNATLLSIVLGVVLTEAFVLSFAE